ncbi:MAG: lysine 2,3-aminomutase [Candidatus Cloacimonadota bacterium]|nr:MAG: lysine 2,3-aminomutase [Candidatus Cloacimonadota bacterium]
MKKETENSVQVGRLKFISHSRNIWEETPEEDWNNWMWQQSKRVKTLQACEKVINLSEGEVKAFKESADKFNVGITPYYASLMDKDDVNCPIRQQSVPQVGELLTFPEDMADPLNEEGDMPTPCITHRYPDRVLFYVTHNCPVYCRHCTRKRKVADPSSATMTKQLEDAFLYIEAHPEIRDIVISGGDPLSLSDKKLDMILTRLRSIPHIEIFRLGTRNLVTLPQRVTDEFCEMLKKHQPVYVNTHFNHPKECTYEAYIACKKLADAGCVIGNQTVLLKGVNDDPKIMMELNHKLLAMRVRPYYIYQCDLSEGISHFRTSIEDGINIIEHLRGHTSGLANPTFVVDAPGGGGKIPLLPEYLVKKEGRKYTLRNYENKEFVYTEPELK